MLHPERNCPENSFVYKRLSKLWQDCEDFSPDQHVLRYMLEFDIMIQRLPADVQNEYNRGCFYPVVKDMITQIINKGKDVKYSLILGMLSQYQLHQFASGIHAIYANLRWSTHNKPIYTVSKELAEVLQYTQIDKYPSEFLSVPFPIIYLELPIKKFKIKYGSEEEKALEGIYILQEPNLTKTWELIAVCEIDKNKGTSEIISIPPLEFPENKTVDECIQIFCNENSWFSSIPMIDLLNYICNVMIYVASPNADITFYNASKEYRDLKDRAMKAQGHKREKLNQRLKQVPAQARILLGKNIVIDRKIEKTESSPEGKRSLKVRSYIPGYWNTYHVGKGRTQTISKLVRPFFRGPEDAPLTTPKRRIAK